MANIEYETISTESDRLEIENSIKEAAASLLRIDSERDLIKDIAAKLKEEFEIAPGDFNKVVRMYHKQSRQEEKAKHSKVMDLYAKVFKVDDADDDQD